MGGGRGMLDDGLDAGCRGVEVTMLEDGGTGESLEESEVSMSVSAPLTCSSVSLSHSGQDSVSVLLPPDTFSLLSLVTLTLLSTLPARTTCPHCTARVTSGTTRVVPAQRSDTWVTGVGARLSTKQN